MTDEEKMMDTNTINEYLSTARKVIAKCLECLEMKSEEILAASIKEAVERDREERKEQIECIYCDSRTSEGEGGDGMKVKWIDDMRPMPGNCPLGDDEMAFDMSLVVERRGNVISTSRTFWGGWKHLVLCDDGKTREVDAGITKEDRP